MSRVRSASLSLTLSLSLMALTLVLLAACSSSAKSAATPGATVPPTTVAPTTVPGTTIVTTPGKKKPKPAGANKKFCADAKLLADQNAREAKDIATNPATVITPAYRSKSAEIQLPILLSMALDAPAAIKAVAKDFDVAYTEYVHQMNEVGFQVPPPDEAGKKIVEAATTAYAGPALKDLPLLDKYVTTTCGFTLNLQTAP